ncbi:MAG: 30S ribosomal protein S4 [Candidatus Peribacteraceae bacterium]|jgi:small subunit ribosomal protein S4|nr:30S ribosomal protein S4 [bacterium]MDP6561673.1 30S ribosomal protein S4 [Candidatus Peribacteraceae bacterium]|tara:strand:- start:4249 stop:4866 length:618 start_codon:yes stop_codon:yes gene_type:complete
MKFTGPKAKRCRRQGTNIYGSDKYDKILQRKPYGPGKGPRTRGKRPSEYGKQLLEKQKARDMFGLSERQFIRLYKSAAASKEQTGEKLLNLLERRLDNTLYRAGFALTRLQSRQFASHGLFTVNGVRVTSPSYRLKEGDIVEIRSKSKNSSVFSPIMEAHEKYMPPSWLKVDVANLKFEVTGQPEADDFEQAIDVRQVIEYYSRR